MMHSHSNHTAKQARRAQRAGFTLLELVVVMAVIGILVAISVPAVMRARNAARRTQCLNNAKNLALALVNYEHVHQRLPAAGNFADPAPAGGIGRHHNWVVSILPYIDQGPLFERWDLDLPIDDPANVPLTRTRIPVLVCPMDLSTGYPGDLSYVVSAGVGFTTKHTNGVRDCVVDSRGQLLDLNGDASACAGVPEDDEDRRMFKRMGLFFFENWKAGDTVRHHRLSDVFDGASQTFLLSENVRTGADPDDPDVSFAMPDPRRSVFFIGNPCNGPCSDGNVDYTRCNLGDSKINSGLWKPEGTSAVPNSFHQGGAHMAYADGHVSFLNESVDGAVYAALASPQGLRLEGTPIEQPVVSTP